MLVHGTGEHHGRYRHVGAYLNAAAETESSSLEGRTGPYVGQSLAKPVDAAAIERFVSELPAPAALHFFPGLHHEVLNKPEKEEVMKNGGLDESSTGRMKCDILFVKK